MDVHEFQELVWHKGRELYRDMPWRDEPLFYYVLVSEIMLQQTQVPRVLVKFAEFMQEFPNIAALAAASLADVLRAWQGLGYNRRAKFLHEAAKAIVAMAGEPMTMDELVRLPGIGRNTAAAIMNYVYEIPTAFVETNIRTVYFHHFFAGQQDISDKQLLEIVEQTMDREHPREWFWALMDYGAQLKSQGFGRLDTSKHYKKQSQFQGSRRQIRGSIIRELTTSEYAVDVLRQRVGDDERFDMVLADLVAEGLVSVHEGTARLTS